MAKLYTKKLSKNEPSNKLEPSKKTLDFIMNYSKALKVTNYKGLQFDNILN
ncbi:hypothetical protein SAMN05444483_106110 [Salegentibacter echinorum]|uniref:Uncharacterized protein n=1 Tax=Salegentibacter echinorum TaxID=1073325 RepID=A0A1M5I1W2_SALEC|nr:hypothetical protein [Salegentibacter echinorum]SHG22258.1 hypothetical protein SAMN05444483_106110 [Salegentibacter echinorum]